MTAELKKGVSFRDALQEKIIIGDGAMGTTLQSMGISKCPDLLMLDSGETEKVIKVHLDYLHAGSDIIQTNTFGSNPIKLKALKHEKEISLINRNAVEAARTAKDRYRSQSNSQREIFIAADIGPLGALLEPSGTISFQQAVDYFSAQIEALVSSKPDLILIETIMDINEAFAAIEAAKNNCGLPIVCTLTFGPNGTTLMGNKAADAVKLLQEKGADVVGANCSLGSKDMLGVARMMRESDPRAKLIFQPNAGLPVINEGKTVYNETPELMAENISRYMDYKPSIIGGCCGSTPQHIKKIIQSVS